MHRLEQQGNKRAGMVNRLLEHKEQVIGTLLLGNSLVNILASALATGVLIDLFGAAGVVYATAVMTRPGGDLRRSDAQDLCASTRRPGGAGAGAGDRSW